MDPSSSLSNSLSSSLYGFRDLEESDFVAPDNKYKCTACLRFLQDPMQTMCGHRICRACFEEELNRSGPEGFMCRAQEDECEIINRDKVNPDFSASREMGLQLVYCFNRPNGCEVTVQLKKLKDHLSQCQFALVPCPAASSGCTESLIKDAIEKHFLECKFRPEKCQFCNQSFSIYRMQDHLKNDCPLVMITCPYGCDAKQLLRSQLSDHRNVCPKKPKDCTFKAIGCKFQGSEVEVENHEANSSKDHLELSMVHIMQLSLDNSKLNGTLQRYLSESDILRMKLADLEKDVKAVEKTQQSFIAQIKQSEQMQLKMLASHGEKVLTLEDKMKSVESIRQEVVVIREKFAQTEQKMKSVGGATSGAGFPDAMREQFVNHDRTIGIHDVRLAEISLRLQCMETTNYDGVLIWKICEYQRRRRDAVNGTTLSLYSQPFYTNRFGYKMCARVYLNGDGAGKGTHISFFFVVMQGDYDDILHWPFQQKVTLTLLDQRTSRRHISDTFRPDPSSSSFTKPISPMNVASGCPLFVPHSLLDKDDTYLKNDTLFFKVFVDTYDLVNP